MKIAFLGAARTVTGSQHLVTVNGYKILLDCGLYQGSSREAEYRNGQFDFEPEELDAVILSHAHIDHCGLLPKLVKEGYQGPVYATNVSAHLADILLRDSGSIQESEAEEQNRRRNGKRVKPLYTEAEAGKVSALFKSVPYEQAFEAAPGVTARLVEAGHILGSAAVSLEIEEEGGKKQRLWFSGDIGRRNLPLIRDPVLPDEIDTLIMECTYGDKSHDDPLQAIEELREVLARTVERGGKVIIPAFAVGRTQEIVYDIHQMIEKGELAEVPVFVDSPLAVEASKIFIDHPEFFDDETRNFLKDADSRTALGFDMLTYVQSVEESRALHERDEPMVIISASGMAESGRVVHHIRRNIGDPRCTVLIVSYQAPNTLGRALADGEEQVQIFGEVYERKAEAVTVTGLSAHAGQDFLCEYALAVKGRAKQVFLVHGEERPAGVLQDRLQEAGGMGKVYYPFMRQVMEV